MHPTQACTPPFPFHTRLFLAEYVALLVIGIETNIEHWQVHVLLQCRLL